MNISISIITLLVSATFGWYAVSGCESARCGCHCTHLSADAYDREHTLYWGIVGINFIASIGLLILAIILYLKGF